MKMFLVLITLLASTLAIAGDRNTAYEMVCKPMPFDSDRNNCVQKIRPYNYFDNSALEICASFPFTNTKLECLGYIGDKYYEAYEMETCRNEVFDSRKLQCLRDNGQQNGGGQNCIPRREVLNQLRAAQNELRQGQTGTVDKRLTYLIGQFSGNCQ